MLDHALFLVGGLVIASSIALAFLGRPVTVIGPLLLVGAVFCVANTPGIQRLAFKIVGQEASVEMQDLKSNVKKGATDLQAQIADNNQKVQSLSESIIQQQALNKQLENRLKVVEQSSKLPVVPLNTNIIATSKNNGYSVLLFYRDSRVNDASVLKQKLIDAGYQSASINSSLSETTIEKQPDNSEFIAFTAKGEAIIPTLEALIKATLKGAGNQIIEKDGPFTLRRGDVQIYLF